MKSHIIILLFIIFVALISCSSGSEQKGEGDFQFPEKVNLHEVMSFTDINKDQFFARPNIIEPISNGEFIVGDLQRLQLYHFDESANLLGSYGREGRGPGEYERISDIIVKGDTIKVVDGRSARVTTYEVKNQGLNQVDISDFEYVMMKEHPAAMLREFIGNSDNTYTALYYDFNISSQENPRITKIVMVPYTSSFKRDTAQNSFALNYIPEFEYEGGILSVPYAERGFYTEIKNHLVYAVNHEPMVKFYSKSGKIEQEISLPDNPKKLTSEEKEEAFINRYRNAEDPDRFRNEVLAKMPEERPIVRGLLADADDRIWVHIFSGDSLKGNWLIFDKEGNIQASLDLPEGHTFRNAKGNRLFTQRETKDGPEIVITEWE